MPASHSRMVQILTRLGQPPLAHGPLFVAPPEWWQMPPKMELVATLPLKVKEELEQLAKEYATLSKVFTSGSFPY